MSNTFAVLSSPRTEADASSPRTEANASPLAVASSPIAVADADASVAASILHSPFNPSRADVLRRQAELKDLIRTEGFKFVLETVGLVMKSGGHVERLRRKALDPRQPMVQLRRKDGSIFQVPKSCHFKMPHVETGEDGQLESQMFTLSNRQEVPIVDILLDSTFEKHFIAFLTSSDMFGPEVFVRVRVTETMLQMEFARNLKSSHKPAAAAGPAHRPAHSPAAAAPAPAHRPAAAPAAAADSASSWPTLARATAPKAKGSGK